MVAASGTARADDGYCREYQRSATIGGTVQQMYGTACMQPDGSWRIASPESGAPEEGVSYQVANIEPQPVIVQQPVVYQSYPAYEPVYTNYRYYPGPAVGLSLDWSNHDGWRGGRGDWHGGRGWHH